ncbi:MAG: oligopeptide/dipeptide ABC transporter ATP-binding protein, partial [Roseovarius sp.]
VAVMYSGRVVEIGPVEKVVRNPHHPYTLGLMQSIPRVGSGAHRLTQIDGAMPRLTDLPTGCAFHPRCPRAFAECKTTRPAPLPVEGGHVACHLYQGEPA